MENIGATRHDHPHLLTTNPTDLLCFAKQTLIFLRHEWRMLPLLSYRSLWILSQSIFQFSPLVLLSLSSISNLSSLLDVFFWSAFATLPHVKTNKTLFHSLPPQDLWLLLLLSFLKDLSIHFFFGPFYTNTYFISLPFILSLLIFIFSRDTCL